MWDLLGENGFLYLIEREIARVLDFTSKYKNRIFDHFSATKMAPPGGDIKFVFHRSNSTFPTLSHPKKSCKMFR